MQQSKHWKTQQSTNLEIGNPTPTPTQQSTNWKPKLNPKNIGNTNTNELEINPTICNLENNIL
jgi:hypothetical protein